MKPENIPQQVINSIAEDLADASPLYAGYKNIISSLLSKGNVITTIDLTTDHHDRKPYNFNNEIYKYITASPHGDGGLIVNTLDNRFFGSRMYYTHVRSMYYQSENGKYELEDEMDKLAHKLSVAEKTSKELKTQLDSLTLTEENFQL